MFAGDEDSSGDEDGAASEEEKNEEEQQPSGGAGGSKATPLAGPTACARVSSLSLKDGFDFSEHDSRGLAWESCSPAGPGGNACCAQKGVAGLTES